MFSRAPEELSTSLTEFYCLLWLKQRVYFLSETEIQTKAELTVTCWRVWTLTQLVSGYEELRNIGGNKNGCGKQYYLELQFLRWQQQ